MGRSSTHPSPSHETNRLIEGTKQNIATSGCIGGEVTITANAPFLTERLELFEKFYEEYKKSIEGMLVVALEDSLTRCSEASS